MAAVDEHLSRWIGPPSLIWHEEISEYVHTDIHIVKPTSGRPWTTLVTSGMSESTMRHGRERRSAELVMALPPDWPLDGPRLREPANYWPIGLLQRLAEFPHRYQTDLWMWHTVPNGDPPTPYAESTELCCALLMPPLLVPREFEALEFDGESIRFLGVVPLYLAEMETKLKHGMSRLADLVEEREVDELLIHDRSCMVPD